ncbi:MAG: ATP-binding protein, partial [Rhodospirillales bacterium]|nr:ATP-binding protein [Rhodospirillales bacterium]
QKLEAIGKLASGIAHEINTPSQYIGDNLSFLSEAYKDLLAVSQECLSLVDDLRDREEFSGQVIAIDRLRQEKDTDFLYEEIPVAIAQARDGINQISEIVLATKDFSHPSAQERSLVDLNHALENIITISRNEWKYVCRTETLFNPDLPPVSCMAGELKQVFLNLVVNSAHAIAAAGRKANTGKITVATSIEEAFAVVRISDNGTGIPHHIQDRVFDPFFTTKELGKGTGQGLAIARDIIVTKHGGTIGFETEPEKGTTFTIRLPIDVPRRDRGRSPGGSVL